MLTLSHHLAIVVPSERKDKSLIDPDVYEAEVNACIRFFSEMNGGATAFSAKGGWILPDGKLALETVSVVVSFTGTLTEDMIERTIAYAESLKNRVGQDAVSVIVDGKLHILQ
ncbi:MAG: hypothetical protein AAF787_00040 [Chloroflexota bacterium]